MANPPSFNNMKEIKNRTSIYQQRVACKVENEFFMLVLFMFHISLSKNPFFSASLVGRDGSVKSMYSGTL